MVDLSGAGKAKNPEWILENTSTKLEKLKEEVRNDLSSISSDELEDIISSLEESNDAVSTVLTLKGKNAVPIASKTVDRILKAAQFFQFIVIDKTMQERIGGVINSLFTEIKDQSQKLNDNLKDAPHLKRGDKVKNIDPQDAR